MILSKRNAAASFQGSPLRVIHCKHLRSYITIYIHPDSLYILYIYIYVQSHVCAVQHQITHSSSASTLPTPLGSKGARGPPLSLRPTLPPFHTGVTGDTPKLHPEPAGTALT